METIEFLRQLTDTLWGNYGFQALFYFSLILVFVLEKKRIRRTAWVWYSVLVLLVIYNPAMYYLCQYIFGPNGLVAYYCRLFCLIPIVFVITYASVLVLQRTDGWKKLFCTIILILIIAASGHSAYGEEWFTKASNYNKVPDDVLQVSSLFSEKEEHIAIIAPTDLASYMRQIDSRFSMPYARGTDISDQLQSETQDIEAILRYATSVGVDYIVTYYTENILSQYLGWGCEVVGFTNRYVVLKQDCPK